MRAVSKKSAEPGGKNSGDQPAINVPTRQERRILKAWRTGEHASYQDCDIALSIEEGTTKRVVDADRRRQKAAQQRTP